MKPVTDLDPVYDEITKVAARKMVEWLKAGGADVRKPIDNLNMIQMQVLARIAWDTCTAEAAVKRKEIKAMPGGAEQLNLWLAG